MSAAILDEPVSMEHDLTGVPVMEELRGRLLDSIQLALRACGFRELFSVEVIVHLGHVRLQGEVPKYYLKQVATAATQRQSGVRSLENAITIGTKL